MLIYVHLLPLKYFIALEKLEIKIFLMHRAVLIAALAELRISLREGGNHNPSLIGIGSSSELDFYSPQTTRTRIALVCR